MKKEIALFVDGRMTHHVPNLLKILYSDKIRKIRIINRDKGIKYNFNNCAIAVTTDPVGPEMTTIMKNAKAKGIPSLALQDGIVEYEHCWKKRLDRYRPLITDCIAVFGNFTKQILMSWGIAENRIFVTGCPRFDSYHESKNTYPDKPNILLTCANTPYIDDESKNEFRLSFINITKELENCGINYSIRLSRQKTLSLFKNEPSILKRLKTNQETISQNIGYKPAALFTSVIRKFAPNQFTIAKDICNSSAVITTISTVALESMALKRPVAILDYTGDTMYHTAPWKISDPKHIRVIVQELINPPPAKMMFQKQLFKEYILCDGKASRRIANIIYNMMIK